VRYVNADLNEDVVSSYDQTKTTIFGRVNQKTIGGKTVLGPPLNKFVDIQTDTAITMAANNLYLTSNGRMFVLSSEAVTTNILLYNIDYSTGVYTYVGRILVSMPDISTTTTVYRSLKVIDTGTTGWKIFLATTGSVLINGGLLLINNIDLADFAQVGYPTIQFATGNNQKAVYFLQENTAAIGAGHLMQAAAGAVLDSGANRIYVHNGIGTAHQYYVFDTSVAPTYSTSAVTGAASTDVISHSGHSFINGDPVVFTSLTGGTGLVVGTVYFVVNSVAGTSYQLSATSGGPAFNFTTDISAANIGRAFGTTGSNFLHKTGNLPSLSGTLLLTDSEDYAMPAHTSNAGFGCSFFCTTTNLYMGRLSELTAGATTWPSLQTVNSIGAAGEIVVPSITYAAWSNVLDKAIVSASGFVFIMKQFVNSALVKVFGGNSNKYLEGISHDAIELQSAAAISALDVEAGWIAMINTAAGQRGVIMSDLRSDVTFDHSYIITKVLDAPASVLKFLTTTDALFDYTGSLEIHYRTSGFGVATGGWTPLPFAEDLTAFASGDQIQFKIYFDTLGLDTSIPAQLEDFFLGFESLTDSSDHWELSVDDSDNGNPSRTAFRLKQVYSGSVPTLRYIAKDLSNVTQVDHNSSANAARFSYSTDGGVSWNALGVIPNVVGTLVRYEFSAPPGVDIRPALREL